ncbi:MAG: putative quinol monooxygenase [Fusobacteriaceae bacterium]
MVRVVVPIKVKKEFLKKYLEIVQLLIEKSRGEDGCLEYNLVKTDIEDFFYFIELWKDEKSFKEHIKTEHFEEYVPVLNGMLETNYPPEVYNSIITISK